MILPFLATMGHQQDPQQALLDKMVGRWVLRGTVGKQHTTHDIDARWVLNKEYIQIHEVSREKDGKGKPQYEAIIYVVWDKKSDQYACLWLDNTDITTFEPSGIGHAKPDGDRIFFVFGDRNDGIETTFSYDSKGDSWTWNIENVEKNKNSLFARLVLTRH